jgi:hypothetical protein
MHLMDTPERKLLAAEHFERLQAAVRPAPRPIGRVRRHFGKLLIFAGERIGRETLRSHEASRSSLGARQVARDR